MYNKMRLIRLTSSSNGEFSNNFNEDIVITPNSKIGLKSASISLNPQHRIPFSVPLFIFSKAQ